MVIDVKPDGPTTIDITRFSEDDINAAFQAVCNPEDWRAGNTAWVATDRLDITRTAVSIFTGSELRIVGIRSIPPEAAIKVEFDGLQVEHLQVEQ